MPDEFLPQYKVLLKKAHSDLATALCASASEDQDLDDETVMFHLHQAAEKYLKALLAKQEVHFDRNHDISYLLDLCRDTNIALPDFADELESLNPYAVQGRYEILGTSAEDMSEAIARVKKLREHVEQAFDENRASENSSNQ